jgi:hypothetical protein
MGHGFWKNGCTTPLFFEACPYTWKSYIFHSSWSFKIHFFKNFIFSKVRVHLDLHIYYWKFLFYEKFRSQKIPQELLVLWKYSQPFFNVECI